MSDKNTFSLFRKVASSLWHDHGDPSVYGFIELDVTDLDESKVRLLPVIVKSLGYTMTQNGELRSVIRWGSVVLREDHCISVMVNIPEKNKDLSVLNIYRADELPLEALKKQIEDKAHLVRQRKDPHLGPMLKLIRFVPKTLLKYFLKAYAATIYDLKARFYTKYLPHRPFGSVIVSNVGSLGIKKALLPLVPLARPTLMLAVGKVCEEPKAVDGRVVIRKISHIGVTFDHRIFDGSHAAKMLNDFENSFYSLIKS